ncbi:hypothetical protein H8I69_20930 [Serratia fonticola]|uniref:hypothetical protein n=1 Tax=Serratia fonticola TaxID=47917 RepID=UPI0015C5DA40|nr:hypothetical protein [Serratia fonticola]MBC3381585.1 hypothetical protein [Serratia fonticola]NYA40784.1 hypothetical protein [Serratia fonticola]
MSKVSNVIYTTPSKTDGSYFSKGMHSIAMNETIVWEEYKNNVLDYSSWEVIDNDSDKSNLLMFLMGELIENMGRRKNDNIKSRSGLVLDYDSGDMTFEDIQKDLEKYEYVLYSSPSYGKKEGDRCRIVIPFDMNMTANEWTNYKESFKNRFPYIDSSCFTISQGQNTPAYYKGIIPYAYYNNSGYFMSPFSDIEYIEPKTKNNTAIFNTVTIPDDELTRVFDAFVENNRGNLSRSQAWFFAQVMKAYGIYDYQRVSMVQSCDATTNPMEFFQNTAKSPVNVWMLKKYLPKDFVMPKSDNIFNNHMGFDYVEEMKIANNDYNFDCELFLEDGQYLSDVADKFIIKEGVNLFIADCGVGKTFYWSRVDSVIMACPLLSIVSQNQREGAEFNKIEDGVGTYQQLKKIYNNKEEHEKYSNMTLVIDEGHGLYLDDYKHDTNNLVHNCFALFKSVVIMSGTIRPDYFSKLGSKIENVIRVHKKQKFKKTIKQYRTKSELDILPMAIENVIKIKTNNKMIILLNNKKSIKKLMRAIQQLPNPLKLLVYTAETKENDEVKEFLRTSDLGPYDGIIGTNSIVEGLNINTEVEECDVHVIGDDISCERIEQVTNRWRKCSGNINVYHYTLDYYSLKQKEIIIRTANEYMDAAEDIVSGYNKKLALYDEIQRIKVIKTYEKDDYDENIYWNWNNERFEVSYTKIDYELAESRHSRTCYDYEYYKKVLGNYGFCFRTPIVISNVIDISNIVALVELEEEKKRCDVIDLVRGQYNPDDRSWTIIEDNPDAEVLRGFVSTFVHKGLKPSDVDTYLIRLKEDKHYWKRLSSDIKNNKNDNIIRNLIIQELPRFTTVYKGIEGLTGDSKYQLANVAVQHVFKERYDSNAERMMRSHWGKMISIDGYTVNLNSDNRASSNVLNEFITLGKSISVRLNGDKTRFTPIEATTLTGFEL